MGPKLLQQFAKKHGPGMAGAAAVAGAMNSNQGEGEQGSGNGRNIGDIEIPQDATPNDARDILTAAGAPAIGNTQDDEDYGTGETGTVHEIDISGKKARIRVMDGNGDNDYGPRISVTNGKNPKQMIDAKSGRNFQNGTSPTERIDKSHIPLKPGGD